MEPYTNEWYVWTVQSIAPAVLAENLDAQQQTLQHYEEKYAAEPTEQHRAMLYSERLRRAGMEELLRQTKNVNTVFNGQALLVRKEDNLTIISSPTNTREARVLAYPSSSVHFYFRGSQAGQTYSFAGRDHAVWTFEQALERAKAWVAFGTEPSE